jgi:hypothetical protein
MDTEVIGASSGDPVKLKPVKGPLTQLTLLVNCIVINSSVDDFAVTDRLYKP